MNSNQIKPLRGETQFPEEGFPSECPICGESTCICPPAWEAEDFFDTYIEDGEEN